MKFFLIVSFIMTGYAVDRPMFLFKTPNFDTRLECQQYVSVMHMQIYQKAAASYNYKYTPEAIFCITRDELKSLVSPKPTKKTETKS